MHQNTVLQIHLVNGIYELFNGIFYLNSSIIILL
jgi:hypothetical protein